MKKIKIFTLLAMTAFMFAASCGKESEIDVSKEGVSLIVKLPAGLKTRAVEDPVADHSATSTIDNMVVFLLNGTTVVPHPNTTLYPTNGIEFEPTDITAEYKLIEGVPGSVNRVVVVANIPSDKLTDVKTQGNYTAIADYAYTIASQNLGSSGDGGIENLTMMGQDTPHDATPPQANYQEVDIVLDALTARFEIGAVKAGTGIVPGSIDIVGVFINNVYTTAAKTTLFQFPGPWTTSPVAGVNTSAYGSVTLPTYSSYNVLRDPGNALVNVDADSKVYAYHVFAGTTDIPRLILLVKGEYQSGYYDTTEKYFLKWITFTKFLDGGTPISTLLPNTIYKVGVGATGITIDAEHLTIEPELEDFDLGVNVDITEWVAKNVTPQI